MRRKRNRFKSDVIIDLTSLLDVIFIILLVVLCGQSSMKENLTQMQADAKDTQAQAEQEYKLYKEQIEIVKYYEHLPKPVLIAIQEYLNDELYYRNPEKEKRMVVAEKVETADEKVEESADTLEV